MAKTFNYNFKVETQESGQRARYGDSYYSYTVQSELDEHTVKKFCTEILQHRCVSEEKRRAAINNGGGADAHFQTYYTLFKKIRENTYEFRAVSPSTH
jgi:hypothetical protein